MLGQTWLKAAVSYHKYFEDVEKVVLKFDPKDARIKFQDGQVQTDFRSI